MSWFQQCLNEGQPNCDSHYKDGWASAVYITFGNFETCPENQTHADLVREYSYFFASGAQENAAAGPTQADLNAAAESAQVAEEQERQQEVARQQALEQERLDEAGRQEQLEEARQQAEANPALNPWAGTETPNNQTSEEHADRTCKLVDDLGSPCVTSCAIRYDAYANLVCNNICSFPVTVEFTYMDPGNAAKTQIGTAMSGRETNINQYFKTRQFLRYDPVCR